jgi:L-ectoine synthase
MIVRRLDELAGTGRETVAPNWASRRLVLRSDGMGFSVHDTVIRAGTETRMQYLNHFEAVYCVAGEGAVEDLATGEVHAVRPGTLYALDRHDAHVLRATTELRLVCVFNPALVGPENHDHEGAYPLLGDDGQPVRTPPRTPERAVAGNGGRP